MAKCWEQITEKKLFLLLYIFIPSLRLVEINLLVIRMFLMYHFLCFSVVYHKLFYLRLSSHLTNFLFDAQKSMSWNDNRHHHTHH